MSITVHNLDSELDFHLRKRARKEGKSLNRLIKELLRRALDLDKQLERSTAFDEFCGVWSEEEAREFDKAIFDTRRIDTEDWQ